MADLDAIRRGLAANLAVLKPDPIGQVSPFMLDNPTPPSAMVSGLETGGYSIMSYGTTPSVDLTFLIEVCLGKVSDIGAQKLLNRLLAPSGSDSLIAAVEADNRLTSRMDDQGKITTDQDPAADDLGFVGFRGQLPFTLPNTTRVLLAVFAVRVVA